jgi:hypothetical protein
VAVSSPVRTGAGAARLGGANGVSHKLSQTITVPSNPSLSLYVQVQGSDTSTKDRIRVRIIDSAGDKTTVATFTAAGPHGSWQLVPRRRRPSSSTTSPSDQGRRAGPSALGRARRACGVP